MNHDAFFMKNPKIATRRPETVEIFNVFLFCKSEFPKNQIQNIDEQNNCGGMRATS